MMSVIAEPATCKVVPHPNRAIAVGGPTGCACRFKVDRAREST